MFTLENEINNVQNEAIRPVLNEIKSSYYAGNYRSAVVVTYTAVIMDLLDKVTDLSEIYGDDKAKKILEEMVEHRKNKPNDSSWEWDLIEKIKEQTELLDVYDLSDLGYVKTQRNFAAHPVAMFDDSSWVLKEITQETCIDVIRKAFEIVFLRKAVLGKKIFLDIVSFAQSFLKSPGYTKENFEKAVNETYLSRVNPDVKDRIVKDLQKFIFKLDYGEDANRDRESNFQLLCVIISQDVEHYIDVLVKNKINELSIDVETESSMKEKQLTNAGMWKSRCLALLVAKFPQLLDKLSFTTKTNLKSSLNCMYETSNPPCASIVNYRSVVIWESPEKYVADFSEDVNGITPRLSMLEQETLELVYSQFMYYGKIEYFKDFAIDNLSSADSFQRASNAMPTILWLAQKLSQEEFDNLLTKIDGNSQFTSNFDLPSLIEKMKLEYQRKFGIDLSENNKRFEYDSIFSQSGLDLLSKEEKLEVLKSIDKRATEYSEFTLDSVVRKIVNSENPPLNFSIEDYSNIKERVGDYWD